MVSSDIKGILRRVLGCLKREDIGDIVKEWGMLSPECSRDLLQSLASSARTVPRKTVLQKIVDECLKQKVSKEQIAQLDLLCSIHLPNRKKWSVYELKPSETDSKKKAFDPHVFFKEVTKHLSAYFKHDLCMDQRDEAVWLRIGVYEAVRDSPFTFLNNAVYVVYHPRSNRLIMSKIKKGLVDYIMQALLMSLECSTCKETKLSGYHIDSLADLTLNSASQGWFSKFRLNQVDTNPLVKSQPRKRKGDSVALEDRSLISENTEDDEKCQKELDNSFGPNKQPRLEKLCYEMETKFRGVKNTPGMATRSEAFHCTIKFEGKNVLEGVKRLRSSGIASSTSPHLFEQVLSTGKNHFRIYDRTHKEKKGS